MQAGHGKGSCLPSPLYAVLATDIHVSRENGGFISLEIVITDTGSNCSSPRTGKGAGRGGSSCRFAVLVPDIRTYPAQPSPRLLRLPSIPPTAATAAVPAARPSRTLLQRLRRTISSVCGESAASLRPASLIGPPIRVLRSCFLLSRREFSSPASNEVPAGESCVPFGVVFLPAFPACRANE